MTAIELINQEDFRMLIPDVGERHFDLSEEAFSGLEFESSELEINLQEIENSWSKEKFAEHEFPNKSGDLSLAISLHKYMDLSRSKATDMRVWASLSIGPLREYTRTRWGGVGNAHDDHIHAARLIGKSRPTRQALYRLWLMAELTYDDEAAEGERYKLTEQVFMHGDDQELFLHILEGATHFFDIRLLRIFISKVAGAPAAYIRTFVKNLTIVLVSIDLSEYSEDEIEYFLDNDCGMGAYGAI